MLDTIAAAELEEDQRSLLEEEFGLFLEALVGFGFAVTKTYWNNLEKKNKGSGGLFSITVNPYTCKGCMECVEICQDNTLVATLRDDDAIEKMYSDWALWLDLPTTDCSFNRIDDLDEKIGALHTLLLDKDNYSAMVCGDGACLGYGEKTVIHLFTSTLVALMQPRVKAQVKRIDKRSKTKSINQTSLA